MRRLLNLTYWAICTAAIAYAWGSIQHDDGFVAGLGEGYGRGLSVCQPEPEKRGQEVTLRPDPTREFHI